MILELIERLFSRSGKNSGEDARRRLKLVIANGGGKSLCGD